MRVLVAFNDTSMGGTSRSAVAFAEAWQDAGAEVLVYCPNSPHLARTERIRELGIPKAGQLAEVSAFRPHLVHLHHGAPSPELKHWVSALLAAFQGSNPAVLTHDIFGQGLGRAVRKKLHKVGSKPPVVGLLGDWLAGQHRAQYGRRGEVRRIVPNPQDFAFFRPPTTGERVEARLSRGIAPSDTVLLRVGSPIGEKWTTSGYLRLAELVITSSNLRLRLIGAPDELQARLPKSSKITLLPTILNDEALRSEYWAADIFMHWADRGESFGNVILESLGTGLPVIYRQRPLRDNTPWEFQGIPGFTYAKSTSAWLRFAKSGMERPVHPVEPDLQKYGLDRLRAVLGAVLERAAETDPTELQREIPAILQSQFRVPVNLPSWSRLYIFCRHNPLTAVLKSAKRRLQP